MYYKVIFRGFPDERDCLYYVFMGLNSIPDKQRVEQRKRESGNTFQQKLYDDCQSQKEGMIANIYTYFQ